MVKQGREPLLLVFPRSLAHTLQPLGHPYSTLCWLRVRFHDVLLGHGPSLHPPPPSVLLRILFGSFIGTAPVFDSSLAFMPGLRFPLPGPIPGLVDLGYQRGLPVLVHVVSRRAIGSGTTPGSLKTRAGVSRDVAFPMGGHGRRPDGAFRSSIPRPSIPLSTLHLAPREARRKTRGQDGSLLLSCGALSSPTTCRFIPALALPYGRASVGGWRFKERRPCAGGPAPTQSGPVQPAL